MFGYLRPDYPNLYMKDDTLYRAHYCGLCKSIKKRSGNVARFSLTYDVAFMSHLLHAIKGVDVKIEKKHCITHWIRTTPVAIPDDISLDLADVNLILAHYKCVDDVIDEKKGKIKSLVVKKGYKRAKKRLPEIDEVVKNSYERLRKLESDKSDSVDIVSDCFAEMLKKISALMLKDFSNDTSENIFYLIGKWVYLIDALDDYDKDIKNGTYNVFYESFKSCDYKTLISENSGDLNFIFGSIVYAVNEEVKNLKVRFNKDLIVNVLTRGIPKTTKRILTKNEQRQII